MRQGRSEALRARAHQMLSTPDRPLSPDELRRAVRAVASAATDAADAALMLNALGLDAADAAQALERPA